MTDLSGSNRALRPSCSSNKCPLVLKLPSLTHSQGYHNLSIANHALHDPSLTPYGEEQCRRLNQYFPDHQNVELLVASPIRRTIYTTLLSFEPGVKRGLKVIALPELQETSDLPCDTGSDLATLHKEFHDQPVDLSLVHTGWNSKTGKWAPDAEAIATRCREARQWLKSRPEKEIVVVTHGGFLHYLTEDWTGSSKFRGLSTAFSIGCQSMNSVNFTNI